MGYSFNNLSPPDFEELSRELLSRELGIRFEAFGPGPDGGVDGRHCLGRGKSRSKVVLQCKHYYRSRFPTLLRAIQREISKVLKLKPKRYLLTTTHSLTIQRKQQLEDTLGPLLQESGDIFGAEDINSLLRKYPDIQQAHVKLWLSDAAVLERVIRSAAFNITAMSREDINRKVRIYVQNDSFADAKKQLEKNRILIISGAPGVGKTTLAEMLAYAYIGDEWKFEAIRSLEDGFVSIIDAEKTVYFFDDFLGRAALDQQALAARESDFARFVERVRRTPNARFILTTRAYIYEEAKHRSEVLSDKHVDMARYVLDAGQYNRKIRAKILYNHVANAGLSKAHLRSLTKFPTLAAIIDHRNYNPRIIQWMTDKTRLSDIPARDYGKHFIQVLNNPSQIWDTAFRTHIPFRSQNVLIALYFSSEYGVSISDLQAMFGRIHPVLSKEYGFTSSAKDFAEGLRSVEGSFVVIRGTNVSFINPSVRDYLSSYLADAPLLKKLAACCTDIRTAEAVYQQFLKTDPSPGERRAFPLIWIPLMRQLQNAAVESSNDDWSSFDDDLRLTRLVERLMIWFNETERGDFLEAAIAFVKHRNTYSYELASLGQLAASLRTEPTTDTQQTHLADELEKKLVRSLKGDEKDPDYLKELLDVLEEHPDVFAAETMDALHGALNEFIEGVPFHVGNIDSESTLNDMIEHVDTFARHIDVASVSTVQRAKVAVQDRIQEVNERTSVSDGPALAPQKQGPTQFTDTDVEHLFLSLPGLAH